MHSHTCHTYKVFRQYEQECVELACVWLQMPYHTVHIDMVFRQYEFFDESVNFHAALLHNHKDHI